MPVITYVTEKQQKAGRLKAARLLIARRSLTDY
jgi:hypothetical protein